MRHFASSTTARGLTLLEVVAGMALMATLLTTILVAFGSNLRQIRRAQQRLAAIRQADRLLGEWFQQPNLVSVGDSGDIPDNDQMVWRTREISTATGLDLRVVRLEIFNRKSKTTDKPLAAVDFVLPAPETPAKTNVSQK